MKKKYIALSDYCSSVRDGTHDTPKPTEQGKYLVTSRAVNKNTIDFSSCYFISENDFEKINKRSLVEQWDVIMTMIGSVGRLLLVKDKPDYAIKNMALFKIGDEMRAKWLYYYLSNNSVQTYFEQIANGTSQHFIGLGQLRKLKIADFSKESTRIASILSAYDNLIEANSRRIKILEQMAENLYKEWFVRFRFPNYQNTPIENGIPKGWEIVRLNDVIIEQPKSKVQVGEVEGNKGQYPFYTSGKNILHYNQYLVDGENILLNTGGVADVKYSIGKIHYSTDTWCIKGINNCTLFLYLYLQGILPEINSSYFEGAALKHLKKASFKKKKLILPPSTLIAEFDFSASVFYKEIFLLRKSNQFLTRQRDLLLPRLMSGQLIPLTNQ